MLSQKTRLSYSLNYEEFWLVFVSSSLFIIYCLVFELTKLSPLASSSIGDILYSGIISFGIASFASLAVLVLTTIASTEKKLLGVIQWLPKAMSFAIVFVSSMVVIENFSYNMFGIGLKSGEEVWLKVLTVVLCSFIAIAVFPMVSSLASRAAHLGVVTLVIAVGLIVPLVAHQASNVDPALSPSKDATPINVLVLSSDGINASQMGVYGYRSDTTPFLTKHRSEFSVYQNAYTNNGNTTGSIVALLNGISPVTTGVVYPPDVLPEEYARKTLPYLLGKVGFYRVNLAVPHFADAEDQNLSNAFEENNGSNQLFVNLVNSVLGDGVQSWFISHSLDNAIQLLKDAFFVEEYQNPMAQIEGRGDTLTDEKRLQSVLDTIATRKLFFINTHFMNTHGPMFSPKHRVASAGKTQEIPFQAEFYDDAIRDFDSTIERIYLELTDRNILEHTIVIVTSDHGQQYNPRRRVPLLIRFPNKKHVGDEFGTAERIDIAPTILASMGYQKPIWMEGADLTDPTTFNARKIVLAPSVSQSEHTEDGWVRANSLPDSVGRNYVTGLVCNRYVVFGAQKSLGARMGILKNPRPACTISEQEADELVSAALRRALARGKNRIDVRW
ncbi:sulfatase-like hydrolase/transferase [Phyllobacterium bourgognense]|uniref:Arylsulfatase A-like enzyme n=1 Tax=Phyllobacterium bourgognense TaxID=314236 RepID=A0A368YKM1_9HYPH|nr:sulfatase-like hydrolase/transferase [Phyllobacterium bourgognense]RCW80159.1 arylsulfatase A-like enzyme [Phyllobacterium bourgognense]